MAVWTARSCAGGEHDPNWLVIFVCSPILFVDFATPTWSLTDGRNLSEGPRLSLSWISGMHVHFKSTFIEIHWRLEAIFVTTTTGTWYSISPAYSLDSSTRPWSWIEENILTPTRSKSSWGCAIHHLGFTLRTSRGMILKEWTLLSLDTTNLLMQTG